MDSSKPSAQVPLTAREIFLGWERLRIPYNLLLSVTTVLVMVAWEVPPLLGCYLVAFAVPANVLYTLGPTVECYVAWLGWQSPWFRWLLWCAGTLFSAVVAVLATSSVLTASAWNLLGQPFGVPQPPSSF